MGESMRAFPGTLTLGHSFGHRRTLVLQQGKEIPSADFNVGAAMLGRILRRPDVIVLRSINQVIMIGYVLMPILPFYAESMGALAREDPQELEKLGNSIIPAQFMDQETIRHTNQTIGIHDR